MSQYISRLYSALLFAFAVLLSNLGWTAENAIGTKHVFIVSFDQGNPDLIQKTDMPVFHKMAKEGAHTWEAYTIVPSITLPSHTSMLTGVGIQKHQVTWNGNNPERAELGIPTIFSLAKENGLKTAMFVGKEKLGYLAVPGTVDFFVRPQPEDNAIAVAKAFAEKVGEFKPNLTFIHFRDPDTIGHKHGAYSAEKIASLKDCDEALGIIKKAIDEAGLTEQSVIILTADHGGHDVNSESGEVHGTHGSAQPEDVLIPWVAWGNGTRKDFTTTAPVIQYDTAATALWLLDVPIPEHFWGRPVTSAFETSGDSK